MNTQQSISKNNSNIEQNNFINHNSIMPAYKKINDDIVLTDILTNTHVSDYLTRSLEHITASRENKYFDNEISSPLLKVETTRLMPSSELAVLKALITSPAENVEDPPNLGKIGEQLAAMVARCFVQAGGQNIRAQITAIRIENSSDYFPNKNNKSVIILMHIDDKKSKILINIDLALLSSLLTLMLGGDKGAGTRACERGLSAIELRLVERLAGHMLDGLIKILPSAAYKRAGIHCIETDPQRVDFSEIGSSYAIASLDIDFGNRRHSLDIILSSAAMSLLGIACPLDSEGTAWISHLTELAYHLEVVLEAVLIDKVMMLGEVTSWQAGDTIDLAVTTNVPISLRCWERLIATGLAGQHEEKMMMHINHSFLSNENIQW